MAGIVSRWLKKPLLASVLALSVSTAASPAHAFLDSEKAWNDLLQFAVRQINAPGEFEIELGKVTKPEDGFALISSLKVKDADGVWLDASGLLVDWNPTSLLRGRFAFETLSADDVNVLRAPIGRGDPPGDEAQIDFAWPRPPVTMVVETLLIKRIAIAEGLLPQNVEAKVEGRFLDRDDIQEATLGVTRLDRPGDSINLGTRIDFDDLDISISLEAAEAPGGLVAELAGLPETEALEITAAAAGNPDELPFSVYADIGQIGIADGEGIAQWSEKIAVTFDGEVSPGDKTAGQWRTALGDAARIKLDAEQTDEGAYTLNAFQIDSEAFAFKGDGTVDPEANAIDLDFDWAAKNIDALNAVMAPSKVTALSGSATAVGALNAPKVDVKAVVRDLTAGFGSVDAMDLVIDSTPQTDSTSQTQQFSFIAQAEGLALNDDALQQALGETPTFRGNGAFFGAENRIAVESVSIKAASLDLDGNANYDLTEGSLDAELSGAARKLGPFLRAAGLPVDGVAELAMKIQGFTGETVERMFLNAQLSQLSSEDANYAAIMGETAVLEALLVESDPGVVNIERGFFESATLRTDAKGQFSVPADSVDLALDWKLKDAVRIAPVIAPAKLGAAEGNAILKGTLSEPKIDLTAVASDIDFEGYGASRAEIISSLQMRKDLRAPFSMTSSVEGFRAPDPTLAALVGSTPTINATGIYDTATSLVTLDESAAAVAAGDFTLKGDVHLKKRTLDASYTLVSRDLATLGAAADVEMSGKIDAEGSAVGPFTAPIISSRADVRDLKLYGYGVEAMDLDLTTEPANEDGDVPFSLDLVAVSPSLGDPDLEALIGDNPKIAGQGTFNPEKMRASLTNFAAELDAISATAKGDVDVLNKTLDLNFDLDASDLSGLSGVIDKDVTGALKASGSASGSFVAPEVDLDIDGQNLRFDQYSVGSIKGRVDVQQALVGYSPFDVDVVAQDVDLGDPSLNALIGPSAAITAKGEFNQIAQALTLDSARFDVAAAKGTASGSIDLSNQVVDMVYDVDVSDLKSIGEVAGVDLAGAVAAKGSAKGRFTAPQIDTTIKGRGLRYQSYEVANIDGTINIQRSPDGFAPFDIDVEASGVNLGDPALDALIGPRATVTAKGEFNQTTQALNLESARFDVAAAKGTASGSVDLSNQRFDMVYDVDVSDLEPIGEVGGVDLAGAVAAKGSAKGRFTAPQIDTTIKGRDLRFEAYEVASIEGKLNVQQSPDGFAPFDIDVEASGVNLGDPALNALVGPRATISAKGAFNQAAQALKLDRARFDVAAAKGTASGSVDLKNQLLDVVYDLDANDLESIGDVADIELAGSVAAKGSAKGRFAAPQIDTTINGRGLRYEAYSVAAIDGKIDIQQSPSGFAPFNIDVEASGLNLGDPALTDLVGNTASIAAKGSFNQSEQKLRIASADVVSAFATASAKGAIDLADQLLDLDFALDAASLAGLQPVLNKDIAGALTATGSISGSFDQPSLATKIDGDGLRFDQYSVAAIDGAVSFNRKLSGASTFDIDVRASGLDLGDPALTNALGRTATITASGGFDQAKQALSLDNARVITDAATIAASGNVNLGDQTLDVAYDVDAKDLSPFSAIAGNDLRGALKSSGRASGSFTAPQVAAKLNGQGLRYGPYSVAQIDGRVDLAQRANGPAPFDIDVTASGIDLGDPNLTAAVGRTASVTATGTFDQTAQVLNLTRANAATDAARASASGTVDLKSQTLDVSYDVDAGNLGAFAPLVGADLNGALQARGRATGPFVTPAVNTTLTGRGLRYDIYSVGTINGTVNIPRSTAGLAPFNVDVTASAISTGDAALDALIGDSALVRANGRIDQKAQIVELESAQVSTRSLNAAAGGRIDLGNKTLDVLFSVDAADISPATALVGKSLGGALKANGSARGSFAAPIINLDAVGTGLVYDKYSVGQLNLDLTMDGASSGVAPFTLAAQAYSPRLGDANIDALLGELVTVDARGTLDQTALFLRLDDATVRANAGAARLAGLVDLKGKQLDIGYSAHIPSLGQLQPIIGQAVSGDVRVDGRATGGFDDPNTSGILLGSGVVFQTYEMPSVIASYDLRNLITGPRGSASVDAQTPFGPLSANTAFDLSGGNLRIERVSVNGLGVNLDGGFEALPGGLYAGNATLQATDLSALGQFIGQDIAGTANGTVSLNAQDGRQNVALDLDGADLRYAQIVNFGSFTVKGIVNDALSSDPYIDGQVFAASGSVSGFPIQQVTATGRGTLSALEATVNGSGGITGSDKLQTTTLLNLVNFPRGAQVYSLAASYLGVQLASAQQFTLREVPGGGWRADGLDLRIDDGEVVGAAEYSPNGLLANLRMRNVPMKLAGLAGVDLIQSGRLFGDMNIDTRGAPRGDFSFNAKAIRLKGAQLDDPFDLSLMGTLDGRAMDVVAQIESGIINQPLRAVARIPLKQVAAVPVPLPDNFAPFSASVDWEGDVSEFWAFVPAPNHVLSGPVVIRGRAAGTLDAPQLEGGAVLTGGRYQNIEFGTLLDQINATGDFTQDGRVVFNLTATDGVTGTVAARGSYLVADGTIDAGIELNQAALVRRDDATAVISGNATAKSEGNDIAVRGAFRTNFVELRLIGGFGGSVIVVDAIPVGETAPRFDPPSESGPPKRVSLDVSLDFPQQVFVRGRGLDSEWGGSIRATGFASDPKVTGTIERRRGILDLLGRQFELAIGEVKFTGPLDPFIKVRLQRESNDITGWLDITGPASDIELEFGSIPALPPDEVLPRLLFGRSKQSLSGLEAAQLAAGVATLLSGKASALDNVRGALGVDVLRVEGGDGDGTSIATGKYLTEDIFVGAKQNLETGGTSAFVEIEVFDNIELEGEFGADEAEGSANWKLDY